MALVTPRRLRALYAALIQFPPFDRWRLPPPEQVRFRLTDNLNDDADYDLDARGRHVIRVNPHTQVTLVDILYAVAHEMAHAKQEINGRRPSTKADQHNREYFRLRRLICRDLGLDPERFR